MKKIGISFKDTEIELYEFVKGKLSPSIYIKELIKKDMENKETNKKDKIEFDF
ncbi:MULTISPECIES: hypothetical protein [Clostridium]|uniref:Uncharacterized protein n=1 Tax=Clostridium tertium TaxID=1559 RepID=A0A9X3XMJ0_9CLOT|nr:MULTISPECIES: hypothetical protein [Clostridium]MDC4241663.1 hypothetical protein [Clostridium tertium]